MPATVGAIPLLILVVGFRASVGRPRGGRTFPFQGGQRGYWRLVLRWGVQGDWRRPFNPFLARTLVWGGSPQSQVQQALSFISPSRWQSGGFRSMGEEYLGLGPQVEKAFVRLGVRSPHRVTSGRVQAGPCGQGDFWSWTHTPDRWYSVKPTYSFLLSRLPASGAPQGVALQAVSRVWKS